MNKQSRILLGIVGVLLIVANILPNESDKQAESVSLCVTEAEPNNVTVRAVNRLESNLVRFKVTAYCPCSECCGTGSPGVTASGHVIHPGDRFVAADKSIPFGVMVEVPGYGDVPVLDRGGAIKGNKLDVFYPTHAEALEWGVKYIDFIVESEVRYE